jgi:hypothetical protein
MRDWLTIEVVLGALLVTSFTCVGLVALWAATAPRHWFLRTAVLMAVLALPLIVPAYEPAVMFSVQACVVVSGVSIWRRRRRPSESIITDTVRTTDSQRSHVCQFSLSTFLLATMLLAIGMAPAVRAAAYFSQITYAAWTAMVIDGAAVGGIVLVAAWFLATPRKRLRWPAMILLVVMLTVATAALDWLYVSIFVSEVWPPDIAGFRGTFNRPNGVVIAFIKAAGFWVGVTAATTVVSLIANGLARAARLHLCANSISALASLRSARRRRMAQISLFALTVLLAAFPVYMLLQISHRLPMPTIESIEPNGLDDIAAAGQRLGTSPMFNFEQRAEPTSTTELSAEIAKYSTAFAQLRRGLVQPVQVVVYPQGGDLRTVLSQTSSQIRSAWNAAWALGHEANLARRQQRFGQSAEIALQILPMAQALAKGGLLELAMSEVGIETVAVQRLYEVSPYLTAGECRQVIASLEAFDAQRESVADAEFRDRIRDENCFGWVGKLIAVLKDMTNEYAEKHKLAVRRQHDAQATVRLLIVELAARAFKLENGTWPERVELLAPHILQRVPADPFDTAGGPLRLLRTTNAVVAYSLGVDGDDDNGRPPGRYPAHYWDPDGDWRLDHFYDRSPGAAIDSNASKSTTNYGDKSDGPGQTDK